MMINLWLSYLLDRAGIIYDHIFGYAWSYAAQDEWSRHFPLWNHARTSPITFLIAEGGIVSLSPDDLRLTLSYDSDSIATVVTRTPLEVRVVPAGNGPDVILEEDGYHLEGRLTSIHVHMPSEHRTSRTEAYPGELQIVHRITSGNDSSAVSSHLILAVFLQEADTTDPVIRAMITEDAEISMTDLADAISTDRLYSYAGSFTSPPFTPTVRWVVLTDPVPVTRDDLDTLRARGGRNARDADPAGMYRVYQRRHPLRVAYTAPYLTSGIAQGNI